MIEKNIYFWRAFPDDELVYFKFLCRLELIEGDFYFNQKFWWHLYCIHTHLD